MLHYWDADKGSLFCLVRCVPGDGREKEFYWHAAHLGIRERELLVKRA